MSLEKKSNLEYLEREVYIIDNSYFLYTHSISR